MDGKRKQALNGRKKVIDVDGEESRGQETRRGIESEQETRRGIYRENRKREEA